MEENAQTQTDARGDKNCHPAPPSGRGPGRPRKDRTPTVALRVVGPADVVSPEDVVVRIAPDGRVAAPVPGILAGLTHTQRRRVLLDAILVRALAGSLDAARLWLQHARWQHEQKHGRAAQAISHRHEHQVTVVDDLSTIRPVGPQKIGPRRVIEAAPTTTSGGRGLSGVRPSKKRPGN